MSRDGKPRCEHCAIRKRAEEKTEVTYKYEVPEQTDDGWQTAHIAQAKVNESKLSNLIGKILNGTYINIHSVLIIKNGKLVFEEYFPGIDYIKAYTSFTRDDLHFLASATKSFSSTLIGIAIDKGMINGTDEDLGNFFPEYQKELSTDNKAEIKLRDVLSMTAGFDWDEWVYLPRDSRSIIQKMINSEDIIGFILNRPLKDKPGSKYIYNSGLSMLLGTIIEKRSSLKLTEFAQKYLFNPLGISRFEWIYIGKVPESSGGLSLRPRDMAKLGYLYLKKGKWCGEQIVSEKWIEEATSEHIKLNSQIKSYGYQWWLRPSLGGQENALIPNDIFFARGLFTQEIFIIPSKDLVVVRMAEDLYGDEWNEIDFLVIILESLFD